MKTILALAALVLAALAAWVVYAAYDYSKEKMSIDLE